MPKLYACVISPDVVRDKARLVAVASEFAHAIEVIEDGILFDASGLERLIGTPDVIAEKILAEMQRQNVAGSVAVADTVDTAMLLARCGSPTVTEGETSDVSKSPLLTRSLVQPDMFEQLSLADLKIEQDTLNVFNELGLRSVGDLRSIPQDDLISRYGREFRDLLDVLEQKGRSFIRPNIKENRAAWSFELDNAVEDFEQLIFLLNHGLERLFAEVAYTGYSTEHLDLRFKLSKNPRYRNPQCRSPRVSKGLTHTATTKTYEIKTSFPTLERSFWLKLINLRCALDPPEASIIGVDVTAHFTRPRPDQRGLYAVSRPEPESLLLTIGKLKKLVGEENVGVPALVEQRLARPFKLDADVIPKGMEAQPIGKVKQAVFDRVRTDRVCGRSETAGLTGISGQIQAVIAFIHFRPPLRAEVLVRDTRLVFLKTRMFAGHVLNYSGVWKGNSKWWDRPWRTQEWDIEVENAGVYRLCKAKDEWFVTGEYD